MKYKVKIKGNIPYDFMDMILEYSHHHPYIPNYIYLLQPEKDNLGERCSRNGLVAFDTKDLESAEEQ